jgi:glycosyltransferase involved in cell wall biosynthesis
MAHEKVYKKFFLVFAAFREYNIFPRGRRKVPAGGDARMKGIRYISMDSGATGYGRAALSYLRALHHSGVPVTWAPLVQGNGLGREFGYEPFTGSCCGAGPLDALCNRELEFGSVLLHAVPEYVPWCRQQNPGKMLVLYTTWETDRIPKHWPGLLNQADLILVPCEWNREVFRACGITPPIAVVPHMFDPPRASAPDPSPPFSVADDTFVFYSIGVWNPRKAMDLTIRCFLETFTARDPVALVVKTSRLDHARRLHRWHPLTRWSYRLLRMSLFPRPCPRVILLTDHLNEPLMAGIHRRGDAYVSLTHGEGWGLGAFDAAGLGKPVIITGCSGQLDYLPPELSYHIPWKETPVIDRICPDSFSPDQRWADPDMATAGTLMRRVFSQRSEAEERGRRLGEHVRKTFTEDVVTRTLLDALRPALI